MSAIPSESQGPDRALQSGSFLLEEPDLESCFAPEHFSEEERAFADAVGRFCREKIHPRREEIDRQHDLGIVTGLLRELGDLGLFLMDVPEELGGLGASKRVAMQVAEWLGSSGAAGVAAIVQSGIGGLPVVYFGTAEQRARYLEGITSGRILTAYALTEPGSGSDALAARTTATWDAEREVYVLHGTKQFITNAGFADLFVTFAKVDGSQFTCFLVERDSPGLSTGAEEPKMGLKGSSTRSLVLDGVAVRRENVLGEVGKGHRIAFNVLNIGRLKLAPAALGGAKLALREGARYAEQREQFGRKLGSFGLIGQKLAGAAMRIYAAESMFYRTAGIIDELSAAIAAEAAGSLDPAEPTVRALRELAVECSINKVYGSEALDWVVDEMVQVHGGYGFIAEYPVERMYRDARINRIWEGTSEVNRLLVTSTLLSRAMKGQLPLLPAIQRLTAELLERGGRVEPTSGLLGAERDAITLAKKMTLLAAGVAAQTHLTGLQHQQEIVAWLADMTIQVYAMESVQLRTRKLAAELEEPDLAARSAAVEMAVEEGCTVCERNAKLVLAACHRGEELRSSLALLKKLQRREPVDLVRANRTLAARVLVAEGYPFGA